MEPDGDRKGEMKEAPSLGTDEVLDTAFLDPLS
jgi:hypothetical protein